MYFFPDQNGKFRINLKLFSNRIPINNNLLTSDNSMIIGNTKFNFLVENNSKPTELIEFNEYTKKKFFIKLDNNYASKPTLHNKVIFKNETEQKKILQGNIFLKEDLIIDKKTQILEGTVFTISKDTSIVFENKVEAIGSENKPIIFQKRSIIKKLGNSCFTRNKNSGKFISKCYN